MSCVRPTLSVRSTMLSTARFARLAMLLCCSAGTVATAAEPKALDELRINQLQTIGTHNSYHIRIPGKSKREVPEWNYNHAPLDVQLDRGVRSFELDLHYKDGEFEVFHVPLLDEGTTCRKLSDALATVRKWSDAHPTHVPISFLFELKKEGPGLDRRIREVDAEGFDRLDQVLCAGFPAQRRIAPDDVRGKAPTLREAVTSQGWPTLGASRGKVFFILHDEGAKREIYTRDHPSLRGRAMFVRSDDTREDAATLVLDNPRSELVGKMAKAGYFIRTRADADLRGTVADKQARRDAALASGANILSTDFPSGEAQADTGYVVEFPDAAQARVNPVSGPKALAGRTVGP
jgi:hypothetical protein